MRSPDRPRCLIKSSVFPICAGALLFLGCASLLCAQNSTLSHTPATVQLPDRATATTTPASGGSVPPNEWKLTAQFDKNGDQKLDATERQAARAFLNQHPLPELIPLRPGQLPPQPLALEPVKPGERLSPAGVPVFSAQPLYDPKALRTLFLDFDEADWEEELTDFARTDVLVPARLTVDGLVCPGVGVHFRALAAEATLPAGYKRSLDLTLDHTRAGQRLGGQTQLRLLAAATDPTFVRSMLYRRVAAEYLPAPHAGFVRLVINGEYWGVYVSVQPLDENFVQDNFHAASGARWTVSGGGNLAYLGDNPDAYRRSYRLQSSEDPAAWAALIRLCRTIAQAEPGALEEALAPQLDLDGALKFFALENALINQDGYGSNAGSYGLCLDAAGRFHLIPQDAEDSFRLVQVSEYGRRPRGGSAPRENRTDAGPAGGKAKDPAAKGYDPNNFPHQSETNLAMLLSYSFVNKADSDFDGKVTKEEWLNFARAWYFVMDEDLTGQLTREQFIAKVRLLVTPPSIRDGRTRQTFGQEDAAADIGRDLFTALDGNHDGRLTRDELVVTFERWFASWSDPKTARLTQALLQPAFTTLFSQTVFKADQSYIATRDSHRVEATESDGRSGERGERGGGRGGSGLSLGPLHLGGRGGRRGGDTRTLITFSEELDPLAALDNEHKPLLARLLAAPALRARYFNQLRDIAKNWLTWARLGPIAKEYHELVALDVARDTHKPTSYEHFVQELDQNPETGPRDGDTAPSLKAFIDERGDYLRKDDAVNGRSSSW